MIPSKRPSTHTRRIFPLACLLLAACGESVDRDAVLNDSGVLSVYVVNYPL